MGKILATSLNTNSNYSEFYARLTKEVNDYQSQGVDVEVQFSTAVMGTNLVYSALIMARESDNIALKINN